MITINGKRATPNEAAKVAILEVLTGLLNNEEATVGGLIPNPNHGHTVQRQVWDVIDNPVAMTERETARVNEQWQKKLEALVKRLGADRLPIPGQLPED